MATPIVFPNLRVVLPDGSCMERVMGSKVMERDIEMVEYTFSSEDFIKMKLAAHRAMKEWKDFDEWDWVFRHATRQINKSRKRS